MTFVCYLIVCVNLLYSFDKVDSFFPIKSSNVRKDEEKLILNSITVENQDESLVKIYSPYFNLTYEEQLNKKQERCGVTVDMIVNCSGGLTNLMSYKILQIVPSPLTKAYRNNDVFHIRRGVDGNSKTVGCIVGSLKLGKVFSVRPTKLVTIKESHKRVAQVYEDFIRLSPLPANIRLHDGGHWSTLIVRSNEAGDVMAAVIVKPRGYRYKIIKEQQQFLKEYFIKHLPNITLYHQVCQKHKCTHHEAQFVLLYGKQYLMETLNGYIFEISPDSVFPNNKFGTEMFYNNLITTAELKPNTTVLDIYSSRGKNSIMVSKFVGRVVGFESIEERVKEANYFLQLNNIHNVKFLLGRVENNLNSVLGSLNESSDVVAILNYRLSPGTDVVKTIRRSFQISRVVYISYKPNSKLSVALFIHLCSNNTSNFPPFRLTKVIPVDLLPQTPYIKSTLIFERGPVGNI